MQILAVFMIKVVSKIVHFSSLICRFPQENVEDLVHFLWLLRCATDRCREQF